MTATKEELDRARQEAGATDIVTHLQRAHQSQVHLHMLDELRKLRQDLDAMRTRAENAETELARLRGWGN